MAAAPCDDGMYTARCSVNVIAHKHLKLDPSKIDRAKRFLGARTEQETIERALDHLLADADITKVLAAVRGVGGIDDVYGARRKTRARRA